MTENKFEPAKILSKPDPKPNEKAVTPASKATEPISGGVTAASQPESTGQPENDGIIGMVKLCLGSGQPVTVYSCGTANLLTNEE